jgi:hypothetical protein
MIYGGSLGTLLFTAENCEIHHGVSGISFNAMNMIRKNNLHDIVGLGYECNTSKKCIVEDNIVTNCETGINQQNTTYISYPYQSNIIRHNFIELCGKYGIALSGAKNVEVYDNTLVDCGTEQVYLSSISVAPRLGLGVGEDADCRNVTIRDNTIIANTKTVYNGIGFSTVNTISRNIQVYNNKFYATKYCTDNGFTFDRPISWDIFNIPTQYLNPICKNNLFTNCHHTTDENKIITNYKMGGFSTICWWMSPIRTIQQFKIMVSAFCYNAPTTVLIQIQFYDSLDAQHTIILHSDKTPMTVGFVNFPISVVMSKSYAAGDIKLLRVEGYAGNANNVYVSAAIEEV